jgi:hypothetical protein
MIRRLFRAREIFIATMREIFDEAPYQRFLQRTGMQRSVESYRAFMQERELGMSTKARCC